MGCAIKKKSWIQVVLLVTGSHHNYPHSVRRHCQDILTSRKILARTSNADTGHTNEIQPVAG